MHAVNGRFGLFSSSICWSFLIQKIKDVAVKIVPKDAVDDEDIPNDIRHLGELTFTMLRNNKRSSTDTSNTSCWFLPSKERRHLLSILAWNTLTSLLIPVYIISQKMYKPYIVLSNLVYLSCCKFWINWVGVNTKNKILHDTLSSF